MFKLSEDNVRGVVSMITVIVIVGLIIGIEKMRRRAARQEVITSEMEIKHNSRQDSIALQPFDPNRATLMELLGMGLTKFEALSIIRYRESGRQYHIKEELINVYGMSDSLYMALEPYVEIGEEFRYKSYQRDTTRYQPRERKARPTPLAPSKFLVDTVGVEYLNAIGALSTRQAEVFVKWRDLSGIHSIAELRECYVISDSIANALAAYAIFSPQAVRTPKVEREVVMVDLNSADSVELCRVYGIGAKSAEAILNYREILGGFYSIEQLTEVETIRESNYEKIITQIFADSCDISKIDINFASAKQLSRHPYLQTKLRRLLKKRQLKGGWSTIEEMIEDDIFTEEEARRVRPYLHFEVVQRRIADQ